MGTLRKVVGALVLMVVALLGACASGAHGELDVRSTLDQPITVYYPPLQTCCAHCSPGIPCPKFCKVCTDVIVQPNGCRTLNSRAGPYPLEYLKIQVPGVVDYYCVATKDLKLLTARSLIVISGVQCGTSGSGLAASVAVVVSEKKACSSTETIKNLGSICLEGC